MPIDTEAHDNVCSNVDQPTLAADGEIDFQRGRGDSQRLPGSSSKRPTTHAQPIWAMHGSENNGAQY